MASIISLRTLKTKTTNIIRMKNKLLTLAVLSFTGYLAQAQVGINTSIAQATLDVVGFPTVTNKLDGIIAPRLSLSQLIAKTYASAQTGAMVYVTNINVTPTGQASNVAAPGYYYFDGAKWIGQNGTDWHVTGNKDNEVSTVVETLGSVPASASYLGTQGTTDDLVIASGNKTHAVLDTAGGLSGGGENGSSLSWGSGNSVNATSNNIALGKGNTASASGANFPAIAIGQNNNAAGGGKVFGTSNSTLSAVNFAFGAFNTTGNSVAVAVGHTNDATNGGFAFGANNVVSLNNFAFGSNNKVSGISGAIAIGINGTAVADQSVYANSSHVFLGQGNADTTVLGINMLPTATSTSGAAIQMKGISVAANADCTSVEEGAIRYNSNTHKHEGCNGTKWAPFN